MQELASIRKALADFQPALIDRDEARRAAVAMILRPASRGPEVLFIERAHREGDPWSGQMAFPGGRIDPGDVDARGAAERETHEEVGISLGGADCIGQLDDMEGRRGRPSEMIVSGFVYHHPAPSNPVPNYEVHDAFWFPLHELRAEARHIEYEYPALQGIRFPGIVVGEPQRHVVWGLTYRFLERFFEVAGTPLANRWDDEHFERYR